MKIKYLFPCILFTSLCIAQENLITEITEQLQPIILDNQKLSFTQTQTWNNTYIIRGNCTIEGNKYDLFLDKNAQITVEKDATLLMRNLYVRGIRNNNINFITDKQNSSSAHTGKIFCDDVGWELAEHFAFNNGSFHVIKNRTFVIGSNNNNIFSYNSSNKSSIGRNSNFEIYNSTFIYNPLSKSPGLIELSDAYSEFILTKATLIYANTSLNLTHGLLYISADSYILGIGHEKNLFGTKENKEAINIGANKNQKENTDLIFDESAHLTILQGTFNNNNFYKPEIGEPIIPDYSEKITVVH